MTGARRRPLAGTLRIARRELRAYLVAPWAYGMAVVFLVLTGTIFFVVASREPSATTKKIVPVSTRKTTAIPYAQGATR